MARQQFPRKGHGGPFGLAAALAQAHRLSLLPEELRTLPEPGIKAKEMHASQAAFTVYPPTSRSTSVIRRSSLASSAASNEKHQRPAASVLPRGKQDFSRISQRYLNANNRSAAQINVREKPWASKTPAGDMDY